MTPRGKPEEEKKRTSRKKPSKKEAPKAEVPEEKPAPRPAQPVGMKIEPDVREGETPIEVKKADKPWSAPEGDRDLSMPPSVLLRRKAAPASDVEDILDEPDEKMEKEPEPIDLRPPVRAGLFRKIAVGFSVLVVLLLAVIAYVVYARATVTVHPRRIEVRTERVISVAPAPEGTGEVAGEVLEVTVGGEKSAPPSEASFTDGIATGTARIVNEQSTPITLIPTTRLLTPEGVLFRMKDQTTIPAGGEAEAEVYADKPGATGNIGPSRFAIPGLREETQRFVYAVSDEPMTGGLVGQGVANEADIAALEEALKAELTEEAKEELGKRTTGVWTGQEFLVETMSRFVNVAPGEATDDIVVRLTLRVRSVSYDRVKAAEAVVEDLKRGLTSDRELAEVKGDDVGVAVERADPSAGTAALRLTLTGSTNVSLESPLFDADKLRGLDLEAVKLYFEGVEGVERVDVRFRPGFIKRMPTLADRIEFKIAP